MNTRISILIACMLAATVAVPAFAAAKDNDLWQGRFYSDTDTEKNIKNDADAKQEPDEDSAVSAASCQFVLAVEIAVASLGSGSALAVISDEDEVTITSDEFPEDLTNIHEELNAETAMSTCTTPIGPIVVEITTLDGWGMAAPHGTAADVVSALAGGKSSNNGPANDLNQGRFEMDADVKNNIYNTWDNKQEDTDNTAIAAANCQAIVGARLAVLSVALGEADGTIEDGDQVVITNRGDDVATSDFNFTEQAGQNEFITIDVMNNHTATASCVQTITSVVLSVKPEGVITT